MVVEIMQMRLKGIKQTEKLLYPPAPCPLQTLSILLLGGHCQHFFGCIVPEIVHVYIYKNIHNAYSPIPKFYINWFTLHSQFSNLFFPFTFHNSSTFLIQKEV